MSIIVHGCIYITNELKINLKVTYDISQNIESIHYLLKYFSIYLWSTKIYNHTFLSACKSKTALVYIGVVIDKCTADLNLFTDARFAYDDVKCEFEI